MQRIKGQHRELDLAARHLLHIFVHLLHGLEDRITDDNQANCLAIEHTFGIAALCESHPHRERCYGD